MDIEYETDLYQKVDGKLVRLLPSTTSDMVTFPDSENLTEKVGELQKLNILVVDELPTDPDELEELKSKLANNCFVYIKDGGGN